MMKQAILFLAVAFGSAMMVVGEPVGSCTQDGEYLADDYDCTIFYHCDEFLEAIEMHCDQGLCWYEAAAECVWPTVDQCPLCSSHAKKHTLKKTKPVKTGKGLGNPVGACTQDGEYLADDYDCNVFYECNEDLEPIEDKCVQGLCWYQAARECVWPTEEQCPLCPDGY